MITRLRDMEVRIKLSNIVTLGASSRITLASSAILCLNGSEYTIQGIINCKYKNPALLLDMCTNFLHGE